MRTIHTTDAARRATSCLKAILFLVTLVSALARTTPAAADSPNLLQTGSRIARQVVSELRGSPGTFQTLRDTTPRPRSGFVSEELLERVSGLINDGVRVAGRPGSGTLYVNFESHGFGGVVSLRLKR